MAKSESATDLKKSIAQHSPKKRPSYSKGWRIKKTPKKLIVHNKTSTISIDTLFWNMVILLRNGNRFEGKPHIRPQEERVIRDYLKKIERAIEQ